MTKKLFLAIIGILLQFSLHSQDVSPITLHVETDGGLPSLITENRKHEITDLTLIGYLNGTDIRFIREMAELTALNLADVNIFSGGDYYYSESLPTQYYYTGDDAISTYMFRGTKIKSITLPNSVTKIGSGAFYECSELTSITIGNNVASIGGYAFWDCFKLTSITLPNSVTYIGSEAFSRCIELTSVSIGNGVTSIGNNAFYNCSKLTDVTIGNSVTSIGNYAFWNCIGLTSITLPNSVTSIGKSAFRGCIELADVTIGNSVTSIGSDAFYNCSELKEIHTNNPTPPTIANADCFRNINKTTCKLYVPRGSKVLYESDARWKIFKNIIEEDSSSINTINQDKITIQSTSSGVAFEVNEQTFVSVYNTSGQIVYQSSIVENTEIHLEQGVYIVKVNDESRKVIVK